MSGALSLPKSDRAARADYLRRVHPPDWQNPKPQTLYDLVVLGGGSAGLASAEYARRQGRRVALVERDRLGGSSLNSGSIPSKAIIRAARMLSSLRDEEDYGAAAFDRPRTDFAAVMARMRAIRTRIAEYHGVERLCALGIDVFFGNSRFAGPHLVLVGGIPLPFSKAVIATGARPKPAGIPGLGQIGYLTSDTIFDLTLLPKRLGIIGGGPFGCELAQAFCRLGSQVTIVQNEPKFLPHEERDAADLLSRSMSRDGVNTLLNTEVIATRMHGGAKWLDTINDDVRCAIAVDEILLSTGRVPNVEGLDLAAAGVGLDPSGGIAVDEFLCSTNVDVFAAGDVCHSHEFSNIAEASGRLAVDNAFGATPPRSSRLTTPWCTYCDPEIAHIGMQPRAAREQSIPMKSYTILMQDVDRAITDGRDEGFVKIYVREGTDQILGAAIAASHAGELINEMSVIMSAGIGMRRLATILHTYPTQSDAIRLAALAFLDDDRTTTCGSERKAAPLGC